MKQRKKLLTSLVAASVALALICATPFTAFAAPQPENEVERQTGFKFKQIDVPYDAELAASAVSYRPNSRKGNHAGSNSAYAKYTNDYFYNQMSEKERSFYNDVYNVCDDALCNNTDAEDSYLTPVEYTSYGLTQTQALNIYLICANNNPQFYFLSEYYGIMTHGSDAYVVPCVYSDLASGAARSVATQNVMNVVNRYMAVINAESTSYDKVKKAHDMLCANVFYTKQTDECGRPDCPFCQSCYSTFVFGETVCAGYSEAFELLMNAAGITTVVVTSDQHEWNQVWLDGNWYVVDVTFADQDWGVYDGYFLKSNASVYAEDGGRKDHVIEDVYAAYNVPACNYDYGSAPGNSGSTDPGAVQGELAGTGTTPGSNIVSVNDADGTVVVNDGVTGGTATIPVEYTTEGKVYRMYDGSRGEHFYTKNTGEMNVLVQSGWVHEENADFTVVSASDPSAIPVYRLYNPNGGGMHFYTESASEAAALSKGGWQYEGISHYVFAKGSGKGASQYRLYNPNSTNGEHNWTADEGEKDMLVTAGWQLEGIAWEIK